MRFPPWDPPEPTDEQLLAIVHSDTRQLYETGELTRAQRQQLRDGMIAEWRAAQFSYLLWAERGKVLARHRRVCRTALGHRALTQPRAFLAVAGNC